MKTVVTIHSVTVQSPALFSLNISLGRQKLWRTERLRLPRLSACYGTVRRISSRKPYLLSAGLRKLPFRFSKSTSNDTWGRLSSSRYWINCFGALGSPSSWGKPFEVHKLLNKLFLRRVLFEFYKNGGRMAVQYRHTDTLAGDYRRLLPLRSRPFSMFAPEYATAPARSFPLRRRCTELYSPSISGQSPKCLARTGDSLVRSSHYFIRFKFLPRS